jgi:alpha-beta hydrolase superfamily lysophospholipase
MRKPLVAGIAVLVLAVAAVAGARKLAWERIQAPRFDLRKQGSKTPGTYGLAFEDVTLDSGGRALKAFFVAPPAGGPAVLIFHGNGESISSWTPVQKLLFDHGVGSMVFDYSGFGRSQGPARVELFVKDAAVAWSAFKSRLQPGTRACAYGLSLGSGVLLEAAPALQPAPDCLAIWGGYTSLLGAAVRSKRLPGWMAPLMPDALVSVQNIARAPVPVLVEHGESDELFPPADAQALFAAAPKGSRLLVLPGYTHGQPVIKPDEGAWVPVVALARNVPESAVAPVVPPVRVPEPAAPPAAGAQAK